LLTLAGRHSRTPQNRLPHTAQVQRFDQLLNPLALTNQDDPITAIVQAV
jgi:hypothetical protein